jgi:hypothetical protein
MFRDFLTRRRSKQRKVVESGRGGGIGMNTQLCRACPRGLFNDAISTQRACVLRFQDSRPALGEGKNSGIAVSFDAAAINSFAVDSQVFKRGTGISSRPKGVLIYQHLLTTV